MEPSERFVNIADASQPNAGRIYDFMIGGNHNFEVDRKAAEEMIKLLPIAPNLLKMIRWYLGEVVRRLSAEGFKYFIDFASGLPTADHIHQVTSAGTRVLYSDIDPVTVAYAKDILGNNPNACIEQCDASRPEDLLKQQIVRDFITDKRKVAIGFSGIAWFLPDESISNFMRTVYEWAGNDSKIYTCDLDYTGNATGGFAGLIKIYERIKQPFYLRPLKVFKELIKPWKIAEPGVLPLEEWINLNLGKKFQNKFTSEISGESTGILGMILEK